MKNFKILFLYLFLASLVSCGRNEPEEKDTDFPEASSATPSNTNTNTEATHATLSDTTTTTKNTITNSDSGLEAAIQRQMPNAKTPKYENPQNINLSQTQTNQTVPPKVSNTDFTPNSPLRILLKNAEVGKSYSKNELIEKYKFPKEAVDLIKKVTCVGPNKLYFNWGSTWLVEKVSDAEFQNDTMIFSFKKNKTYVTGGAIGIKYNKKIYTELILNNGSAYIPTVKGYHWEINK
ncbi:hypothetical protein [Flavobacterium gilvum]|uniref:Lipoprotein n=1 Tax=Flavobacterium gilvum TaxID=1492737 RepID=A0AAC9I338_9FLAO|nr:hypothetical protein [Flavobacterium gilvum]AOW09125.1 hypothetical protein EM308_06180 [Flavobacterium gilvum]